MIYGDKAEAASSGLLKQLMLHSPKIKSLHSKGSDSCFKFKPLGNLSDAKWFTKSTLIRFIHTASFALNYPFVRSKCSYSHTAIPPLLQVSSYYKFIRYN